MAAFCRAWCRKVNFIPFDFSIYAHRCCSTSAGKIPGTSSNEVIIPSYIPRGPTDILRALASTVRRDPTASHYVYHDDPYLIPTSNLNKRYYALAKESGRRAANYFLQNFPESFENDEAEPKIAAFNPPLKVTAVTEVTSETLRDLVYSLQVENAYEAYRNLKNAGVKVEHELTCELLELLCYYNSSEPSDETFRVEEWFRLNLGEKTVPVIWKDDGLAEMLFDEIEVKDARTYQALVQGLSRHGNASKALKVYSEMREMGYAGTTRMYNYLIKLIPYMSQNAAERWEKAEEFLQAMVQEELEPDLLTFNNLLYVISRMRGWPLSRNTSNSILAEMKALGIEASLGTFVHLLNIHCRPRGRTSYILYDIMKIVESKVWTLQDSEDMSFFTSAMAVANNHLHDTDLADRVYAALRTGNNKQFVESAHKESVFFINYLTLMCSADDPDRLIDVYEKVVPSEYSPDPHIMQAIVECMERNGALTFLPKLWADVLLSEMDNREGIILAFTSALAKGGTQSDSVLQDQLNAVAWSVFESVKTRSTKLASNARVEFSGQMLSDLVTCFLNGNNLEKAWEVVYYLIKNRNDVRGPLSGETVLAFCRAAVKAGSHQWALACLRYACSEEMPEANQFIKEHSEELPKDFLKKYFVQTLVSE